MTESEIKSEIAKVLDRAKFWMIVDRYRVFPTVTGSSFARVPGSWTIFIQTGSHAFAWEITVQATDPDQTIAEKIENFIERTLPQVLSGELGWKVEHTNEQWWSES